MKLIRIGSCFVFLVFSCLIMWMAGAAEIRPPQLKVEDPSRNQNIDVVAESDAREVEHDLTATFTRPLFQKDRRKFMAMAAKPAEVEPEAVSENQDAEITEPPKMHLLLEAISEEPTGSSALLYDPDAEQRSWMKIGDNRYGWTLVSVEATRISVAPRKDGRPEPDLRMVVSVPLYPAYSRNGQEENLE